MQSEIAIHDANRFLGLVPSDSDRVVREESFKWS